MRPILVDSICVRSKKAQKAEKVSGNASLLCNATFQTLNLLIIHDRMRVGLSRSV